MLSIRRASTLGLTVVSGLAVSVLVSVLPASAASAGAGLNARTATDRFSASVRTGGIPLSLRTGAATTHQRISGLADGSRLQVSCHVSGQRIAGTVRTTDRWNRLTNGRYVSDAYVKWSSKRDSVPRCKSTATVGKAPVATASSWPMPLNVRRSAGTDHPRVGSVAHGSRLTVRCQLAGEYVEGSVRRSSLWNRLANGHFVSDAYVAWQPARPKLPTCELGGSAPTSQREFIAWAAKHAKRGQSEYGVPASVTIAQAILESGWGGSALTKEGNAYFGMKCFGSPGPVAVGCRSYRTSECEGRRCFGITDKFRVYRNAGDSFRDHSRQLANLDRYRPAFAYKHNSDQFAREIHKAGYATSPVYASNLIKLMRQYKLYRFDAKP